MPVRTLLAGAAVAAALASPAAASAASACPVVAGARTMPTPARVLGHALDSAPLTPAESDAYLLALDAASSRIITGVAGRSVQGRPLRWALVGDPRSLAPRRRGSIAAAVRRIRAGATGPRSVARAARDPAVVWIGAGVHANEPSGTTATLALLRDLAEGTSCATRRILHDTLTVVVPDQNPDGRAAGTRTNAADIDLNRDWFAESQPETVARLAVLERFPPVVAIDAHEQTGTGYFVPPYASPVVAGLPRAARRFADGVVTPAVDRALGELRVAVSHRAYDLLYPGYADSATSLLLGSGGMTFEQGSDLPIAEKARNHRTAMLAALQAVADRPAVAVRAWAAGFAVAERAGRAGRGVTGDRVYGWALRTTVHGADADALALRLRSQGVVVRTLRRTTTVRLDPLGPAGTATVRLPPQTIVVPADQPESRWADTLLGRDADEAGAASSDADTWSQPRAAGIEAGVLRAPVPRSALRSFVAPRAGPTAGAVTFDGDSAAAARLTLRALEAGRPVVRTAAGAVRTIAAPGWATSGTGVRVEPYAGPFDADATPVPRPLVATLPDPTPLMVGTPAELPVRDRPAGWVLGALRAAGVDPTVLPPATLDGGVPAGVTDLVLGPAAYPGGVPSEAARQAVGRFVRSGGTVISIGAAGLATATQLGVTAVRGEDAGDSAEAAVAVHADPGSDPLGRRLGAPTSVVVDGEPRLVAPAGASVPLRAAAGAALAASGPLGSATGLAGSPLVVDESLGAGHVLTVGFSPAFRRQSAAGERVLLGLLLGPS